MHISIVSRKEMHLYLLDLHGNFYCLDSNFKIQKSEKKNNKAHNCKQV